MYMDGTGCVNKLTLCQSGHWNKTGLSRCTQLKYCQITTKPYFKSQEKKKSNIYLKDRQTETDCIESDGHTNR